ncbi:hypothetical protein E4582_13200 [Luteimonas yindakuii]|uniref:Uncharacterized protein n=3 Tax=Luteimonas yindakuii TaxID=2565782 RepID=A0A4Z1R3M5_9GAMM|nr:hypothetical protein E4582_13200 [Luteimonas yindakuii]
MRYNGCSGGLPATGVRHLNRQEKRMKGRITAAALMLTMWWTTSASAESQAPVLVETDAAAIVAQQHEIRQAAQQRSGRYKDMAGADRERLLQAQERVLGRLDGRSSTTELPRNDQVALFNDLEEISALVNKAEDDRMVCERSRPIGSNRPVSVCKTVAQRREERERALESRGSRDARCVGGCRENSTPGWN